MFKKINLFLPILFFFIILIYFIYPYSNYTNQLHQDIELIIKILKNRHPGYINEEDPQFKHIVNSIESNYKNKSAANRAEYIQKLKDITYLFEDSHLSISDYSNNKKEINQKNENFTLTINTDKKYIYIKIPHFNPNEEELKQLTIINDFLKKNIIHETIIFDLRNNYGGNSEYASSILKSLFGKNYYENIMYDYFKKNPVYIDWRISEDNYLHLKNIKNQYKDNKEIVNWIDPIIKEYNNCLKNKLSYYREDIHFNTNLKIQNNIKSKFNNNIIFITNKKCVSACLDFIDELYILSTYNNNSIIHMGEETNKDSLYMEVCTIQLSDKNTYFNFPIKVYRNRKRKNNESYKPNIIM